MIETFSHLGTHLAIIIRNQYNQRGVEFFTQGNNPLQLGYMNRAQGYIIPPHVHNSVERTINSTHEVLYIKSGSVRIDFYTSEKEYIRSTVVVKGDVVLLTDGGHGFKMLEESELIEVKQGPYVGELDKIRFDPIDDSKISF
jgi:mannose-6-phosphate isomerase-like protein (cupin superfamily)